VINEVSLKQRVVVASVPLQKGQIISTDDLSYEVIEITTFNPGHIADHQAIVGQQAKRRINQGDAVLAQWLIEPKAIRRGDRVTIQASSNQISVATSGTAMADGRLGEQINVRNNRSDRVIRAKVVAEGRVSISL
jgi:flagella basal body P-ring formation protein FlgA